MIIRSDYMNENEVQRKELQRLLGTAKDKDRQELILDALQSLSSGQRLGSHAKSPGSTSPNGNVSPTDHNGNSPGEDSTLGGGTFPATSRLMRPMSAKPRRKASFSNLAVIPENRSLLSQVDERHTKCSATRRSTLDNANSTDSREPPNEERDLGLQDLRYVLASSHDPRHPPAGLFLRKDSTENVLDDAYSLTSKYGSQSSKSEESGNPITWTSTGLMPQLLTLILRDRWLIKRVSVRAFAVEEMSVLFIDGDLDNETSSSATMLVAAQRKHTDLFVVDIPESCSDNANEHGLSSTDISMGLAGTKIVLRFLKSSDMFIRVSEIIVSGTPY